MRKLVAVSLAVVGLVTAIAYAQTTSFGSAWKASALYSEGLDFGYNASQVEVYAPTKEVQFSLWGLSNGTYVRTGPNTAATGSDTVYTVPRGTALYVDLGAAKARLIYFKTLNTAGDDSTAIHISWW